MFEKTFEESKENSVKKSLFSKNKLIILSQAGRIFGRQHVKSITSDKVDIIRKERRLKGIEAVVNNKSHYAIRGPGKYVLNNSSCTNYSSFSPLPRFSNNINERFCIRRAKSPISKARNHN